MLIKCFTLDNGPKGCFYGRIFHLTYLSATQLCDGIHTRILPLLFCLLQERDRWIMTFIRCMSFGVPFKLCDHIFYISNLCKIFCPLQLNSTHKYLDILESWLFLCPVLKKFTTLFFDRVLAYYSLIPLVLCSCCVIIIRESTNTNNVIRGLGIHHQ